MNLFKFILAFICVFILKNSIAQVKTDFNNTMLLGEKGFYQKEYHTISYILTPPDSLLFLRKEKADKESGIVKPFRFAEPIHTKIDVATKAFWVNEKGTSFGKFSLKVKGAKSLSINFSKFYLPFGAEIFIYNSNGSMITGPVTSLENNSNPQWSSAIYKDDVLNIEIKIPSRSKKDLKLEISNVAYGFKNIFSRISKFGESATCNVNILCPEGDGLELQRNSVALIILENGYATCSGALINNANNDDLPYLLTANHCYEADHDVSKWAFIFQYWSPNCENTTRGSMDLLVNGSNLKSHYDLSDFALLELNQLLSKNFNLTYAGWNRNTNSFGNVVGIHHPKGDVMKISKSYLPIISYENSLSAFHHHWQVTWSSGITEVGSSGSPLFDQNGRIIGQLHGAFSSGCSSNYQSLYGRFDQSWYGGGTSNSRLRDWLDPDNTFKIIKDSRRNADLVFQNASVSPTTISLAEKLFVSCKIKNQGTTNAKATITSIWLSKDQFFNLTSNGTPADLNLNADISVPALLSDQTSETLSNQITIPNGTSSGKWYIMFGADANNQVNELDETNNQTFVEITITGLTCSAPEITSQPANRQVNAPKATSFSLSASGSENKYQWQRYTNGNWTDMPNVTPYSGANTNTLNISSTTLDMNGNQYRCKVSSTCSSVIKTSTPATLTVLPPVGCNNDNSCIPKSLSINASCFNTSCTTIGATNQAISFYGGANCLSLYNSSRTDDDVWFSITPTSSNPVTIKVTPTSNLTNFDPVVGLYSSNCSSPTQITCAGVNGNGGIEQLTFTPTANTTYLIRVFSYGIGSAYSGNFDICATATGQTNPLPDLIITNASFSTTTLCAGNTVNVFHGVTNIGNVSASSSTVKYYLSSDNIYSANDVFLGSKAIGGIGNNATISTNSTLTIPSGTGVDTWNILIVADANNDIAEGTTGEGNNVIGSAIQIINCSGSADLVIHYNSFNPASINPGTTANVYYTSQNLGSVMASPIHIGIFISTDNVFDPFNDEFLNDWVRGSLDAGQTVNDVLNFTIPYCYPCRTAYIFLVIDYQDIIPETNNNNNTDYFPIQITGCVSCSYSVPPTGINFQSAGGSGNFNITTTSCCPWTASTNNNWITIANNSGNGSGAVNYTISPCNGGGTRTGTITVAGQSHTIQQSCAEICNASQSFEWAVKGGSTTLSDAAADIAKDAAGNLYMTGDIQGSADFGAGIVLTTPSTAPDIFVSKYNSSGQIQWAVRYGNTGQEEGTSIATDNSGNVYVAGPFVNSVTFGSTTLTSNAANDESAFLIKLNSNGVLQWAKKLNETNHAYAWDIAIDNVDNIYVVGDYTDRITGNSGFFTAKYNTSGTQLNFQTYAIGGNLKQAYGVACDNSGNIIVSGRYSGTLTLGAFNLTSSTTSDISGFISKLDINGAVIWAKQLLSPGQGQDEIRSIVTDATNNIYAVGTVDSTAIVGNITIPLSNSSKAIIIKYDQNGNPLWAKASTMGLQFNKKGIVKGNDNDIYICGDYYNSMKIDSFAIVGFGSNGAFISRIDENGKIKWLKGFGGTQSESARGIITNSTNDLFIAGGFYGTIPFGNTTLTSAGSEDIYLTKFKQCDLPVAVINYNGNPTLCTNQSLTLSTSYCSTNVYQWQRNNIDIVSANNPTFLATDTGTYKVKISAFEGCETISNPVTITREKTVYTFIGTGDFNNASNWSNNIIPPSILSACAEVIINPAGTTECILNVPLTIMPGGKISVSPGKKFRILGNLVIQ